MVALFKNLTDQFLSKMDKLYSVGSTRDRTAGGIDKNDLPIIETKPNGHLPAYQNFGRSMPVVATAADALRMAGWTSKPKHGVLWMAQQNLLQTGNTFGETRALNQAFVLENTVPFIHAKRSSRAASDIQVGGDTATKASSRDLGSAGRLHVETAEKINAKLTTGASSAGRGFFSNLISTATSIFTSRTSSDIEGVGERPELNFKAPGIDSKIYSIALYKGFRKSDPSSNLGKPDESMLYFIADDRKVSAYLYDAPRENGPTKKITGRISPTSGQKATIYNDAIVTMPQPGLAGLATASPTLTSAQIQQDRERDFGSASPTPMPTLTVPTPLPTIDPTITRAENKISDKIVANGGTSMQKRYLSDERVATIVSDMQSQKEKWAATITGLTQFPTYLGGIVVGANSDPLNRAIDPNSKYPSGVTSGRYFSDPINENAGASIFRVDNSGKATKSTIEALFGPDTNPNQLIDFLIYDYVNKTAIPLRAYIQAFNEVVQPEYQDTFYIGRPERNIIYVGVRREANITLLIHAFNETELENIWRKINALTSLCFPGDYKNGFMVPPFIKLTLGDIYSNQPAYIRSLSYQIDEQTTWETVRGQQVPHGITVNIAVAIIEKRQQSSKGYYDRLLPALSFYPFKDRDDTAVPTSQQITRIPPPPAEQVDAVSSTLSGRSPSQSPSAVEQAQALQLYTRTSQFTPAAQDATATRVAPLGGGGSSWQILQELEGNR